MIMVEFVTFLLLLPMPVVVWWLDRQRETQFHRRLFAERLRSERLAAALQGVLADASPSARTDALDVLWDFSSSNVLGQTVLDEYSDWLALGVSRGWVSKPVCAMHDGLPTTDDEEAELEQGDDPCMSTLRLWGPDGRP